MPIRVESSVEELEGNWIEIDDAWTRGETDAYASLSGEPFVELWTRKVVACHLMTSNGAVTDPLQVFERIADLDERLIGLVRYGPVTAIRHLRTLGELSVRLSSNGVARAAQTL